MIQVDVSGVVVVGNVEIAVLLRERGGKRTLPVFVGVLEANSIAAYLRNQQFPRPLTHDLFCNVLKKLGCTIVRVEVCDLVNNTFIGTVVLEYAGKSLEIDSRPSDAIALALRFSAPIYVAEHVMDEAGRDIDNILETVGTAESSEVEAQTDEAETENKAAETPEDALARALKNAIAEERYEEAARIRDQLNELKKKAAHN